jgi:hypothetical protein
MPVKTRAVQCVRCSTCFPDLAATLALTRKKAAAVGWNVAYPGRYYYENRFLGPLTGRHPRVDICPACVHARQQESYAMYHASIADLFQDLDQDMDQDLD